MWVDHSIDIDTMSGIRKLRITSAFESLSGPGKALRAEAPDKREFQGLLRSGHARLHDALNTSLSVESRFDAACQAVVDRVDALPPQR